MRRLLILITAAGLVLAGSPATAAPKARISGSLTVGSTVTVVSKKGTPKKVRWQRCLTAVVAGTCDSPQFIARGRSLVLDSSLEGSSVRARAKVKGRSVVTKWSRPITADGGSTESIVIPADWEITGGSPSAVTSNQQAVSAAYAEIARLVGGGRFLSHFEGGSSGIIIQRELTMCSDTSFRFVDAGVTDITGTWRMTVNFTNPQDVAPRLELTARNGQTDTLVVDLNPARPGHVLLSGEDFLSGPSSSCS